MKLYIIATTTALVALWLTSCGGSVPSVPMVVIPITVQSSADLKE